MRQLERDLEKLRKMILGLGALVEKSVFTAAKAVKERDRRLAEQVIAADADVDQLEIDVEEECLKVLALHQPRAQELRFIVATLKINTDLERVGDLAVNIAWRADTLAAMNPVPRWFDFAPMADVAKSMLRRSLEALVSLDASLAREVLTTDDEIDQMNRTMYREIEGYIREQPEYVEQCMLLTSVSRNLERMADHATNIAEDVIYLIEGEIVRHGRKR